VTESAVDDVPIFPWTNWQENVKIQRITHGSIKPGETCNLNDSKLLGVYDHMADALDGFIPGGSMLSTGATRTSQRSVEYLCGKK
jgi:hypothetical protein